MIFGIGTDIVQISRIELVLRRNGDRFVKKILGVNELEIYFERKAKSDVRGQRFLATRFAAKEAFSKAIGLGMRMPMTWHAMQILNELDGKPIISMNGVLLEWMTEQGLSARVSMSDEVEYAVAFVIVEQI
ncbi:MAG: holo-ACP synthase [Undibacterium sp.]|nr:holo-ACP synthase [Undibacterium sp.]